MQLELAVAECIINKGVAVIVISVDRCQLGYYTVFHQKRPLLVFFIIHSNDDQFT